MELLVLQERDQECVLAAEAESASQFVHRRHPRQQEQVLMVAEVADTQYEQGVLVLALAELARWESAQTEEVVTQVSAVKRDLFVLMAAAVVLMSTIRLLLHTADHL